jgi:hypothetical protein
LDTLLKLDIQIRTALDIEFFLEGLTKAIQTSAWQSTPARADGQLRKDCPKIVTQLISDKREARKGWQMTKSPNDKRTYNQLTHNQLAHQLQALLQQLKNKSLQDYLQGLTATQDTDYTLWKAT